MTAQALLERLVELDVHLAARDGRLAIDAPVGTVSSELRRELMEHKSELLVLLGPPVMVPPVEHVAPSCEPSGHCLDCGQPSVRSRTPCTACARPVVPAAAPDAEPRTCRACGWPIPSNR